MTKDAARATLGRRQFMTLMAAGAATLALPGWALASAAKQAIKLPPLPYAMDALEPVISARTLKFHYGKHHAGYVKKLNKAITGTKFQKLPLVGIIQDSWGKRDMGVFNNAAQVFNHTFYWHSLKPGGSALPKGAFLARIKKDFGSLEGLKAELIGAGARRFGSGWAWLYMAQGKLYVDNTANADTPIKYGLIPLLTIDVWEHAYYLDYQNRRRDYLKAVVDKLINWDFAAANFSGKRM